MADALSDDARDLLRLHLVPGIGPRLTQALLDRFGSAGAALQATAAELQEVPHIGPKLANQLAGALRRLDVDAELARLEQYGVRLRVLGSTDYPARLAAIPDPPHLLYVRGNLLPADERAVAMVGSRHCTAYGRRIAERLATDLARQGWTVISGLARGIDGASHRAALQAGGRTLAVLAGGLSRIYPPEHAALAEEVAANGALITEASMEMEPMAGMFPARNRLISGLARAVVVVEAAEQSGALHTARHASEQNRPVFAVPGSLENPASSGTHFLIRNGAILIRGIDDILDELEGISASRGKGSAAAIPRVKLEGLEQQIWDQLAGGPRPIDEITQSLGRPVAEISQALFALELKKTVRRLPGNQYERIG